MTDRVVSWLVGLLVQSSYMTNKPISTGHNFVLTRFFWGGIFIIYQALLLCSSEHGKLCFGAPEIFPVPQNNGVKSFPPKSGNNCINNQRNIVYGSKKNCPSL